MGTELALVGAFSLRLAFKVSSWHVGGLTYRIGYHVPILQRSELSAHVGAYIGRHAFNSPRHGYHVRAHVRAKVSTWARGTHGATWARSELSAPAECYHVARGSLRYQYRVPWVPRHLARGSVRAQGASMARILQDRIIFFALASRIFVGMLACILQAAIQIIG